MVSRGSGVVVIVPVDAADGEDPDREREGAAGNLGRSLASLGSVSGKYDHYWSFVETISPFCHSPTDLVAHILQSFFHSFFRKLRFFEFCRWFRFLLAIESDIDYSSYARVLYELILSQFSTSSNCFWLSELLENLMKLWLAQYERAGLISLTSIERNSNKWASTWRAGVSDKLEIFGLTREAEDALIGFERAFIQSWSMSQTERVRIDCRLLGMICTSFDLV